jgi:hypothetical protein
MPWDGKCWCTSWSFGIFIVILMYFVAICYVCAHFGTFFPILFFYTKKNLATLLLLAPQNHFPQFKFYLTYFSPPINDRE